VAEQRQVLLPRHRHGAERAQEGAVPLRVDELAPGLLQPGGHVRHRDPRRVLMPAEQGVSADDTADTDPDRATDQVFAQPYLDAVRPAVGVQFGQGSQQRVSEPARLAVRSALLGDPAEHGVGRRPHVVTPQLFPDVPAEVDLAGSDHRPRIG
jgi:hypothetical protein